MTYLENKDDIRTLIVWKMTVIVRAMLCLTVLACAVVRADDEVEEPAPQPIPPGLFQVSTEQHLDSEGAALSLQEQMTLNFYEYQPLAPVVDAQFNGTSHLLFNAGAAGTLSFNVADNYQLDGAIHNQSVIRLSAPEGTRVTLTDGTVFNADGIPYLANLFLDSTTVTGTGITLAWDPLGYYLANEADPDSPLYETYVATGEAPPQMRLASVAGHGTILNMANSGADAAIFVDGFISPSFYRRTTTALSAAAAGSVLTFQDTTGAAYTLALAEEAILAPVIFGRTDNDDPGSVDADRIVVDGNLKLGKLYFIQPQVAENSSTIQSGDLITLLTADRIDYDESQVALSARQQFAWADATAAGSSYDMEDPNDFSSPDVYQIHYLNDGAKDVIALEHRFSWTGNFLKHIDSENTSLHENIVELATLMNYMVFDGTDTYDGSASYLTDVNFLLNVAQVSDAAEAAYRIKQFSPELFGTRMTLAAFNNIRTGVVSLEQMANVRQQLGLRSRLARCYDGDEAVCRKYEDYYPFQAQFEGERAWYAWATPMGQWMDRDSDGLLTDFFGYKYKQYGVNFGLARNIGSFTFGLACNYMDGEFQAKDTYHQIDTKTWQFSFMASWYNGPFFADAWFGYTHDEDDSRRETLSGRDPVTGSPRAEIAAAEYTLNGWSGGLHMGYNWECFHWTISPMTGFRFGTASNSRINESGTGMAIHEEHLGMFEVPIGVRLTRCFLTDSDWVIVPMFQFEWIARFGDQQANLVMDYYNYIPTMYGDEVPSEFHLNCKLNLMKYNFNAGVEYDGSLMKDHTVHRVSLTAGFIF